MFTMFQPNGRTFKARVIGDEWSSYIQTIDGYTIERGKGGNWYYVERYDDAIPVLSRKPADQMHPATLEKNVGRVSRQDVLAPMASQPRLPGPTGKFSGSVLYLLAQFTNCRGRYPASAFAIDLLAAKRYFKAASYGNVDLLPGRESFGEVNDGVVGWLDLGYAHPGTGKVIDGRNQQVAQDAIIAAAPYVDYASYDVNHDGYVDGNELAIVVVVAGSEYSTAAWRPMSVSAHKWYTPEIPSNNINGVYVGVNHGGYGGYAQVGERHGDSNQSYGRLPDHRATIGVVAHELGHLIFGLPDLYQSNSLTSSGIGGFCLMSYGSWGNKVSDLYSGQTPVLPSAWVKYALGWVKKDDEWLPGTLRYPVAAGSTGARGTNTVFRALSGGPDTEYFLVESRFPVGYDAGLQKFLGTSFGGIALWHVDESMPDNRNDAHRLVDLEEADGSPMGKNMGEKTDLWYKGNKTVFGKNTNPNTNRYTGVASVNTFTTESPAYQTMAIKLDVEMEWSVVALPTPEGVSSGWASSPSDVFVAVGTATGAQIFHYDGVAWTPSFVMQPGVVSSLWGTSSIDVFASAGADQNTVNKMLHYDGTLWTSTTVPMNISSVWGTSSTDVFALGYSSQLLPSGWPTPSIMHYDGNIWSPMTLPAIPPDYQVNLTAIGGSSSIDVFAVGLLSYWGPGDGAGNSVPYKIHYDGNTWRVVSASPPTSWTTVVVVPPDICWGSYSVNQSGYSDILAFKSGDTFLATNKEYYHSAWRCDGDVGQELVAESSFTHFRNGTKIFSRTQSVVSEVNNLSTISRIWGTSPKNVYYIITDSDYDPFFTKIVKYDGNDAIDMTIPDNFVPGLIFGSSSTDMFVGGSDISNSLSGQSVLYRYTRAQ